MMRLGKWKKSVLCMLAAAVLAAVFLQGCGVRKLIPTAPEEQVEELPDTVRWFNASYAILTEINKCDYNIFGGMELTEANQSMERRSLEASWEVTNRESADEMLEWAWKEGHRAGFLEDMEYLEEVGLAETPEDERVEFLLDSFYITEEEAENYASWYAMYAEYGEHAIDGWDYCRAMNLLSFYYIAGYYTEEEALDKSLEIAQEMQTLFDSWDDLVDSYLRGYEYWAEESSDERRAVYEDLKTREDNPYAIDFHASLQKEW